MTILKLQNFLVTQEKTLNLVKNLNPEDMVIQTEPFVSPIKWHLAHTTWFFENFILKKIRKYKVFDKSFDYIFNSYYYSVGKFNPKDMRGYLNRPQIEQIFQYRKYVEKNIYDLFLKQDLSNKKKYLFLVGINHEQQHQELILMDILNIFYNNPLKPVFIKKKKNIRKSGFKKNYKIWNSESKIDFKYGAKLKDEFSFDNELPGGLKTLLPYQIETNFVSNKEWKEFISCDGYKRPELWLSDGWDFIQKNKIDKPMYWINDKQQFCLTGIEKINDYEPVSHISFYEADAYCRFKNKRLPTEFEMEFFLQNNKKEGIFLENGCYKAVYFYNEKNKIFNNNCYGNLWTWTSSNYIPYEGYKSFRGNLGEYNKKFMCNQFVLKVDHLQLQKTILEHLIETFTIHQTDGISVV